MHLREGYEDSWQVSVYIRCYTMDTILGVVCDIASTNRFVAYVGRGQLRLEATCRKRISDF